MISVKIDMSELKRAVENTPDAIRSGAKSGMHDVLNDWRIQSTDLAPIDTSTLRKNIKTGIDAESGVNMSGKISANAYNGTYGGQRFNYAYYIHEVLGNNFRGKQPGTIGKFLDEPAERDEDRWGSHIESEIESELKRKGW